jgi:hypothetical protein
MVLATSEDLIRLAEKIRGLARQGEGFVSEFVTHSDDPTRPGEVGFRVISEEELVAFYRPDPWKTWGTRLFTAIILLVILPLAAYGGWNLFGAAITRLVEGR